MKQNGFYGFFSYDYGGGYNLVKFSKKLSKNYNCKFFFKGPAIKALKEHELKNEKFTNNFQNCTRAYYSLSWDKKVEEFVYNKKEVINYNTFLVLDGWGDYKKKMFIEKKRKRIPDAIITLDKFAHSLAYKQKLNKISKLVNFNNFIFKQIKIEYSRYKQNQKRYILYLTSPLIKKNCINKVVNFIKKNNTEHVKIRYHPKEKINKQVNFLEELKNAKKVYGHYSTSLIYASLLGVKTYSINHSNIDIFRWNKFKVFSNFQIEEIYKKTLISSFKKIKKNEYI